MSWRELLEEAASPECRPAQWKVCLVLAMLFWLLPTATAAMLDGSILWSWGAAFAAGMYMGINYQSIRLERLMIEMGIRRFIPKILRVGIRIGIILPLLSVALVALVNLVWAPTPRHEWGLIYAMAGMLFGSGVCFLLYVAVLRMGQIKK